MNDAWTTQLRKGLVELCVLRCLQQSGESYGYQILQLLSQIEGLNFSESTVYPVLARLTQEGLLKTRTAPSPTGPARRYYQLNSKGSERLSAIHSAWQSVSISVNRLFEGESL